MTMPPRAARIRHQLDVWVQYDREADHGVLSYAYHYSRPHELHEQRVDLTLSELPTTLLMDMNWLVDALASQIPTPRTVRLPHAEIQPTIRLGYFTLAIQDQRRAAELPSCRLYYREVVPELTSAVEKEVRITRPGMSPVELRVAMRTGARLRGMAWSHYRDRFKEYFRGGGA